MTNKLPELGLDEILIERSIDPPKGKPFYNLLRISKVSSPFPKNEWFSCENTFTRKCDMPHCKNTNLWFRLNDDGTEWFLCEEHGPDEGTYLLLEEKNYE